MLSSMFSWFSQKKQPEPPRPRNDGRRRELWTGDLPDDEESARAYLEVEAGKLRVYRCPSCGVRVANEADVCRAASLKRKAYGATFRQTFNLLEWGPHVCCLRCGKVHFPFDPLDNKMRTVPLYWNGERTLDKSPARCLIVLDRCWDKSGFLRGKGRTTPTPGFVPLAKNIQSMVSECLPHWECDVKIIYYIATPLLGEDQSYENWVEKEGLDKNIQLYRDQGLQFEVMLKGGHDIKMLASQPTQDLCLLFKFSSTKPLTWTNNQGADHEVGILGLWALCGGNFLFGDWYIPYGCEQHGTEPDAISMEKIGTRWASFMRDGVLDWFNNQPAFAQLALDGHYLGWWDSKLSRAPASVYTKVRLALENNLLYPDWLFLRDFPSSVFEDTRRRGDEWRYHDKGLEPPPPYAVLAADLIIPHLPELSEVEEPEEIESRRKTCPFM